MKGLTLMNSGQRHPPGYDREMERVPDGITTSQ